MHLFNAMTPQQARISILNPNSDKMRRKFRTRKIGEHAETFEQPRERRSSTKKDSEQRICIIDSNESIRTTRLDYIRRITHLQQGSFLVSEKAKNRSHAAEISGVKDGPPGC